MIYLTLSIINYMYTREQSKFRFYGKKTNLQTHITFVFSKFYLLYDVYLYMLLRYHAFLFSTCIPDHVSCFHSFTLIQWWLFFNRKNRQPNPGPLRMTRQNTNGKTLTQFIGEKSNTPNSINTNNQFINDLMFKANNRYRTHKKCATLV